MEAAVAAAETDEEEVTIRKDFEERKKKAVKDFKTAVSESVGDLVRSAGEVRPLSR